MDTLTDTLQLSHDGAGPRHFLNGRPVHCGTMLEAQIEPGGPWISMRYEAVFTPQCVRVTLHSSRGIFSPYRNLPVRWRGGAL